MPSIERIAAGVCFVGLSAEEIFLEFVTGKEDAAPPSSSKRSAVNAPATNSVSSLSAGGVSSFGVNLAAASSFSAKEGGRRPKYFHQSDTIL
mmetsp:Transcript_6908/g.19418  ORF Transcript_6908/g.19418 Transcript_6908/m.19418 type:complete len:92 (+) Transcript_6908:2563-2838(+)